MCYGSNCRLQGDEEQLGRYLLQLGCSGGNGSGNLREDWESLCHCKKSYLIASTFNEATCASLVGKELPGSIQKVSCEPYEYEVPGSGETIELNYRWEYTQEGRQVVQPEEVFSVNGSVSCK